MSSLRYLKGSHENSELRAIGKNFAFGATVPHGHVYRENIAFASQILGLTALQLTV
jgi:hypothetical protein